MRDIDPVKQYVKQTALYLHQRTNKPYQECLNYVKEQIKQKGNNPTVTYFERQDNGDRLKKQIGLYDYIKDTINNNQILVPTFTTYLHPTVKRSFLSNFLTDNIKQRSIAKKTMFKASMEGDQDKVNYYDILQQLMKIFNNGVSGSLCTKGSILYNPTGHSTLTSTTRSITSIANASNERLVAGNRHYRNYEITLNHLIYLATNTDSDKIKLCMDRYNLHYPTTEDTLNVVLYSTRTYWIDRHYEDKLKEYIDTLTPEQKAVICYTGDLYHLRQLNESFVRSMIQEIIDTTYEPTDKIPTEDTFYKEIDEAYRILVTHLLIDELKGVGSSYEQILNSGYINPFTQIGLRIQYLLEDKYKLLIDTFIVTDSLPISTAYLKYSSRKTVVVSDTDSTCFSCDEWVLWWYGGDLVFNSTSMAVAATVMTLAVKMIKKLLYIFSINLNTEKQHLETLAMKNEFTWDVFVPLNTSKHYYANTRVREGNVFPEPVLELKGVHLKTANAPKLIATKTTDMIKDIFNTLTSNQKLDLLKLVDEVIKLEQQIKTSLLKGEEDFYKVEPIKVLESYKRASTPIQTPYGHYLIWNEIFRDKYGEIPEPPYAASKINLNIKTPSQFKLWVESIEDTTIRQNIKAFLAKYDKDSIKTIKLPYVYLQEKGIPKELHSVIDVKTIILDNTKMMYLILESLGYFKKPKLTISESVIGKL